MRGILHQKIELEIFFDIFIRFCQKARLNLVFDNFIENQKAGIFKKVCACRLGLKEFRSSYQGHMVDALAQEGDEGRGKLR